jgi:hypothetical protein
MFIDEDGGIINSGLLDLVNTAREVQNSGCEWRCSESHIPEIKKTS